VGISIEIRPKPRKEKLMRLASFIRENAEHIVRDWESFNGDYPQQPAVRPFARLADTRLL
jgi:hypothetical protein